MTPSPDFGEFPPDETEPASAGGLLAPAQQVGEGEVSGRSNLEGRQEHVVVVVQTARVVLESSRQISSTLNTI